jgi:uncharacterized protein YkwD
MVRRRYFSHFSPSGDSYIDRIRRTGYMRGAWDWRVGENLAYEWGENATPAAIVRAWMRSPDHRANLLSRRYREIGVGVARGTPTGVVFEARTYDTTFGARR